MARSLKAVAVLTSLTASAAFAQPSGGIEPENTSEAQAPAESDEIVVTARYSAKNAVTGTKIDAPLIEVPQSISVVPGELLQDRRPANLNEALYNASGVSDAGSRRAFDNILIRGFTGSFSIYLDGLRVERGNFNVPQEVFGLERIEVLKGPGSVLFGQGSLGGIVNQVSRRPGADPRYYAEVGAGSFGSAHAAVDLNTPLSSDGRIAARLVGLYRHLGDSVDFNDRARLYLSPSVGFRFADTSLIFRANHTRDRNNATYVGLPVEGTILPNPNGEIDRDRYIGEPDNDAVEVDRTQLGYELEHRLGAAFTLRQNLRFSTSDVVSRATFSSGFQPDLRHLRRGTAIFGLDDRSWAVDTNLAWRFKRGGFEGTLLAGVDYLHQRIDQTFDFGSFPALDVYDPVYGAPRGPLFAIQDFRRTDKLTGLYLQAQLKPTERLTVLLGGRYDLSDVQNENRLGSDRDQKDKDFTFRGGAIYQITPGVGLFANYAEAFNPNFGLNGLGEPFIAETGTQYEAGIKTDHAGGRVRTNFAVYQLTRNNVLVPFPEFPGTQIQTGQQRSRGFEADLALAVRPEWQITAAYAYTDVKVAKDTNPALIGDRPINVPKHQGSLWTSYDLQLVGGASLRLGAGGRYLTGREGTLPNTYRLPNYAVFDLAAALRWQSWQLQVNVYNLINKDYVESASPTGQRSVLLGEPFTLKATLGYAW